MVVVVGGTVVVVVVVMSTVPSAIGTVAARRHDDCHPDEGDQRDDDTGTDGKTAPTVHTGCDGLIHKWRR